MSDGETVPLPVPATSSNKRSLKTALIALAVVLVIGGVSAAAYVGVVVPNKPESILKSAINNTLQQKQVSFNGKVDVEPTGNDGGLAAKVNFKGDSDMVTKTAGTQLDVTVSGVNVGLEARYINQDLYFKAKDLTPLAGLAGTFSPQLAPIAQATAKELSNQWIVVDSTLLKQSGGDCILNADWKLTKADLKLLDDQYGKNPFTTIKSTSSDTVSGKKVTKFELSLDDDKMSAFGKNLKDLSLVKAMKSCDIGKGIPKGASDSISNDGLADHDHTPLTVWVDKSSKQIVQIGAHSTAKDEKKDHTKGSLTVGLSYGKVVVTKPEGAKPVMQVFTELQQSLKGTTVDLNSLFGGSSSGGGASLFQ